MPFTQQVIPGSFNVAPDITSDQPGIRVLCAGDDQILLGSRTMVLRQAGYIVRSSTSREAAPLAYRSPFDIALLCRSIPHVRSISLARVIHSHSTTTVIRLAARMGEYDWPFDFAIDTSMGPVRFLRTLAEVVTRSPPRELGDALKLSDPSSGWEN